VVVSHALRGLRACHPAAVLALILARYWHYAGKTARTFTLGAALPVVVLSGLTLGFPKYVSWLGSFIDWGGVGVILAFWAIAVVILGAIALLVARENITR
jgi:hypothetical protein